MPALQVSAPPTSEENAASVFVHLRKQSICCRPQKMSWAFQGEKLVERFVSHATS